MAALRDNLDGAADQLWPPSRKPPAVILAGGRSSRFGADKALALWQGRPLVLAVAERLAGQVSALAVNTADPARACRLPLLPDRHPGLGPLAGILAALERWPDAPAVLTVPCDTPLLPTDLVARLRAGLGSADAVCAAAAGRCHPVIALWRPRACRRALADALGEGRLALRALGDRLDITVAPFPEARAFANINRPEDLEALEAAGDADPQEKGETALPPSPRKCRL